ncbi:bifunctional metallophosphatase/5'-nucleotidase [Brumimicrobium aurantiacum]|uniref:Bifunctional metallophosphatase/5'-nucleotidase n=1 Tax=Brumimicrobium aurantiacum TaxID=1737063 RepID=A0A3E1EZK3_9FLAO|nr:metallophosphatase [Brumimicrobium aurantiacum]RFC55002.1 bifunctional metallophosphatase/5'-nucleotidase [Brumimicrobium aurantiacum]
MERRIFLQKSAIVGTGLAISPSLLSFPKHPEHLEKITILHTNDTHSNIETFPSTHAKYPDQGGVARRYSLLKQIRKEEKNVLLLDAGDIFQGTPYFNKFHGELEMKLMSHMGYDCATMGNHDFDAGLEGFLNAYQYGDFPFVCSNYNFDNTVLKDVIKEYQIFKKGPFKIGVFGVGVQLNGLVAKANFQDTTVSAPIPVANGIAKHLRFEEECDLVICLSHLGYEAKQFKDNDQLLAAETENIDLIIGGHTHTFLPKPEVHTNKIGEKVLINQVGWAGLALGRIDFYLGEKKRHKRHELVMV